MAEAAAAVDAVEFGHHVPHHFLDALDDQLRDAVAAAYRVVVGGVGVHEHGLDLAAIRGVDQAGRVDDADAVLQRQPGAGHHQPAPPDGDRDRDPGRHERPTTTGAQERVLTGVQVEAGIAEVGVARQREVGVELHEVDGQLHERRA